MSKMKKKVLVIALAISLIAMASLGTLAWFTDSDTVTNNFYVAGSEDQDPDDVFSIDVWEDDTPADDPTEDKIQDGIEFKDILPGDDLYKEVNIENTGAYDQYVRAIVTLSDAQLWQVLHGEIYVSLDKIADDLSADFTPWSIVYDAEADTLTYVLYYNNILKPDDVANLFTNVHIPENLTREQAAKMQNFSLKVVAEAVQTENVGDTAPAAFATVGKEMAEGNFGFSPNNWAVNGYKAVKSGDTWYVVPDDVSTLVASAGELQNALDSATDGSVIYVVGDIAGNVTATQKPDVKVTIEGNGNTFAGVLTVDGKSGTYTTAGLTVKNFVFKADSISADACIQLGNGTNATRYTCNVTVENCTFDVPGAVGVKSYTGGDKNLTITGCTATAQTHSLVQAKGIDGVLVENCNVYSKNGLNFNNSDNVTISGCTVDVKGYAVRFGESSGGVGAAETYRIKACALKSACDDGDAVIVLRGTADNATLTIENTTIEGTIEITNTATGATVVK